MNTVQTDCPVYWHERTGYLVGKDELDIWLNSSANKDCFWGDCEFLLHRDSFVAFDSRFKANVHKLLSEFVSWQYSLELFTQVYVDLSVPGFCDYAHCLDFLIARSKDTMTPPLSSRSPKYTDILGNDRLSDCLLMEVVDKLTPESSCRHVLLEQRGFRHGKDIEIVQPSPQYLGGNHTKSYKTLHPSQLLLKLAQSYLPE